MQYRLQFMCVMKDVPIASRVCVLRFLPHPWMSSMKYFFSQSPKRSCISLSNILPEGLPRLLWQIWMDCLPLCSQTHKEYVSVPSGHLCIDRGVTPLLLNVLLLKVERICVTWKGWIQQQAGHPSRWLEEVLDGYDPLQPCHPLPVTKRYGTITAPMTLDPSLSYASRQPQSDGRITQKSNMTISGTRFATVLAYIGAMRFLRAQPVAGNLIAYTLPLVAESSIERVSTRSVFRPHTDGRWTRSGVGHAVAWIGNTEDAS